MKSTESDLRNLLGGEPSLMNHYRHRKTGKGVRVLLRSVRESDREPLVTYFEIHGEGPKIPWTRTVKEFFEEVEVEGVVGPRFVKVT